jgi:DeoR/GlpR family transcriptional regulator of sugar metabolism
LIYILLKIAHLPRAFIFVARRRKALRDETFRHDPIRARVDGRTPLPLRADAVKLRKRDRQQQILAEFRASSSVRFGNLASQFGVTKETIRRDIDALSAKGLLTRTYGGAVAPLAAYEPELRERTRVNPEGRRRMARHAAELIAGCDVIMIDTGATMAHLCQRLLQTVPRTDRIELTVITNSLKNITILAANPAIRVIVCPGDYDDGEAAAFGWQTVEFVARYNAQFLLASAGGIDGDGVTDANSAAVAVKRAMLKQAEKSVFLMERRKFNVRQAERVCALPDIDHLVIDEPVPAEVTGALASARVAVHLAEAAV